MQFTRLPMTDNTTADEQPADEQPADVQTGRGTTARVLALRREQGDDRAAERWFDPKGSDLADRDGGEH